MQRQQNMRYSFLGSVAKDCEVQPSLRNQIQSSSFPSSFIYMLGVALWENFLRIALPQPTNTPSRAERSILHPPPHPKLNPIIFIMIWKFELGETPLPIPPQPLHLKHYLSDM